MGLFSTPKGTELYYNSQSQIRSHPQLNRRRSNSKSPERESKETPTIEGELSGDPELAIENVTKETEEKEVKEIKTPKSKNKEKFDRTTSKNTELNSLMYHTSEDSVDLYAKENDSDLIGRIYYDDFDSDSIISPSMSSANTPLLSPTGSVLGSDYFGSRPHLLSPVGSRNTSFTNLKNMNHDKRYERGISFDTSTNIERISLTLKARHPKFRFRRNNKTFLTGYNNDKESLQAIKWLFDEMIINGDTIVILQVLDEKFHHEIDKPKCNATLESFELLNVHNKKISIVYEIDIGKPQKLLKKAIDEYAPQMMAIGMHSTDKESGKGFFSKTTMSKYFLQYALVPVIVVKPTYSHVEELKRPIEDDTYFKDWLTNIDMSDTYYKDKKSKRKSEKSNSRSSSFLNLTSLEEDRGRRLSDRSETNSRSTSRSTSKNTERSASGSRSLRLSKLFHHLHHH